ncbi:cAMP-binding protein [Patiriisocius marinistellae]|uniref:cAMP-binding protein n=1 Tax=Patiriisocius marinistellae TaxID=2494560 RepID=A0A5J4FYB5_9FLAO|nr:cyclic nucleotide-binding domain-containing protein [Patiriisocius marinistellae]GEQ87250.1 cAMP-binding protein [Patiriisocius marinistellae]
MISELQFIREYLETISEVSDKDWNNFSSRLVKKELKKKTVFLKEGAVENNISFIQKGVVRFYIPKELKEKQVTFGFCFKNQFVSAYDSFLTRKPSNYELETLANTTMFSMSYNDLQEVYSTTTIGNLIGRLTAERLFYLKSKREQSLLNETPEQRYLNLFKERPELVSIIPLKYVSSYIGVTPQGLSRIRKRIS